MLLFTKAPSGTKLERGFFTLNRISRDSVASAPMGIDPTAKEGRVVKSCTIDSLNIKGPISFMKVDIQGSDLFAMIGARQTIARSRMPILFEYESQFQREFGTSFAKYEFFTRDIGYWFAKVVASYVPNYLIVPATSLSDRRAPMKCHSPLLRPQIWSPACHSIVLDTFSI